MRFSFFFGVFTLFLGLAGNALADNVNIYAAASTSEALDEIIATYQPNPGDQVVAIYGGSSTLARQIQSGAPADIFLSANRAWMDHLVATDLIDVASRFDGLSNELVLVAPRMVPFEYSFQSGASLGEALGDGRLAMGDVGGVPAGIYGRQGLEHFGQWDDVEDRLVFGDSVRAALTWAARAEVAAAIVYETDAQATFSVVIVDRFPPEAHDPIRYPFALVAGHDSPAGLAFYAYLTGPEAAEIFRAYGFGTPPFSDAIED